MFIYLSRLVPPISNIKLQNVENVEASNANDVFASPSAEQIKWL